MTTLMDGPETARESDDDSMDPVMDEQFLDDTEVDDDGNRRMSIGAGPLIALWLVVALVIIGLVLYLVEPLFQQREQGLLLDNYATSIDKAANQSTGLGGVEVSTIAPSIGSAVAIVESGPISLRQVVVEGTGSSQTAKGPGHVPGTAAPGQPGNSVIVGRSSMYGAPFERLGSMSVGDRIVISTTQGQSLYVVTDAGTVKLDPGMTAADAPTVPAPPTPTTTSTIPVADPNADPNAESTTTSLETTTTIAETTTTVAATDTTLAEDASTTTTTEVPAFESSLDGRSMSIGELYGSSKDDRLTLVTSDSAMPINSGQARVVIAVMVGKPFEPTPQNGRSGHDQGNTGDSSKWPLAVLAFACLAAAIAGAVYLYRRSTPKVAYLLTVPPLLAFIVLASESVSLLLPAWS